MEKNEGHNFSINQCESHMNSSFDTIILSIDSRVSRKLRFLLDTGNEISVIRSLSSTPGIEYQLHEGMGIKGISNIVMKTAGTADLKLYTDAHETLHTIHVLEENFEMQ
jgi:hypothetical protein